MKPSDSIWATNPPEGWTTTRLRFIADVNPSKRPVRDLPPDRDVSFVPMDAVGEWGGLRLDTVRAIDDVIDGYTFFRDGDVVLAKITPCFENGKGALAQGLVNGIGFGTTELHVARAGQSIDPGFLFYVTLSHPFRDVGAAHMQGAGGQKRVPERFVKDFLVPLPALAIQRNIKRFLDRKLARVDDILRRKREFLERLEERREVIITNAVTKGLRRGEMKPSGAEWIGAVPVGWDVMRIKFLAKLESGHTPDRSNPDYWTPQNDIPWVSLNDTEWLSEHDYISDTALHINELGLANSSARMLPQRVVVFTRDATIGKAAVTTRPMAVSQHIIAWVCGPRMHPEYLLYVFYAMEKELVRSTMGATIRTIGMDDVGRLVTPVPPVVEQVEIAKHVADELERIATLRSRTEEQTRVIREFRQALITDAVLGRVDAGDAAVEAA